MKFINAYAISGAGGDLAVRVNSSNYLSGTDVGFFNGDKSYTIALRVRLEGSLSSQYNHEPFNAKASGFDEVYIAYRDVRSRIYQINASNRFTSYVQHTNVHSLGTVYNYAYVYDTGANNMKTFVDGVQIGSTSYSIAPPDVVGVGGTINVGIDSVNDIVVDDLSLWNSIWTATEALEYTNNKDVTTHSDFANCYELWQMDGNGNGYRGNINLTATGSPTYEAL